MPNRPPQRIRLRRSYNEGRQPGFDEMHAHSVAINIPDRIIYYRVGNGPVQQWSIKDMPEDLLGVLTGWQNV